MLQCHKQAFSEKVKILSFLALIGVLFIHSQVPCTDGAKEKVIQDAFVNIARFSVPFFFLISGYFFFKSQKDYLCKVKHRVKSLCVPYVLWSMVFIIMVSVAAKVQSLNNDYLYLLHEGKVAEFLGYVFLSPAAFHLWYIRDLIMLVVISPILGIALKHYPGVTLAVCFVFSVLCWNINFVPYGMFFYVLGGYYANCDSDLFDNVPDVLGLVFFISALTVMFLLSLTGYNVMNSNLTKLIVILLFIIGIWKLYDVVRLNSLYSKILIISDCTFFIYCAHIPIMMVIKKCIYPGLINDTPGILVSFFLSPFVCVLLLLTMSVLARRFVPKIYYITTGGR